MRPLFIFLILFLCLFNSYAQKGCGIIGFNKLKSISDKDSISDKQFDTAVELLKNLEKNNCLDYIKIKNGEEYVVAGRTFLFGEICVKKNDHHAVDEYMGYMKRHHGSAEEQISFSFEELFLKQPQYILSLAGNDKSLIDQLEWGFVNNHWKAHLTPKNYKVIFYQLNPKVKEIYPTYKKQIDYLLKGISAELKADH